MRAFFFRTALTCSTSIALAAAAVAQTPAPSPAPPRDQNQNAAPAGGDAGTASSVDDMEAAVLGSPGAPGTTSPGVPPAGPQPGAPPPRRRRLLPENAQPEASAAAEAGDETGFVIELSTGGFASGTLQGGLFLGGRLASGLIIGGNIDYASSSQSITAGSTSSTTSASVFRLGAGASYPFIRTADHRVDLYGAASAGIEAVSAEAPSTSGTTPASANATALGFSMAVGPGLRLWVHDHVAIGYLARLRWTHLSGDAGAISPTAAGGTGSTSTNASSTDIGFEGVFQVLGVF